MRVECDCVSRRRRRRRWRFARRGRRTWRGPTASENQPRAFNHARRTTATTAYAYTHARDISHHISPSFSRVVTRASNAARRTAAPIMALTRTRPIFATVGSPTTMALTTTPSAMAVPSRAATKNTCTYANDLIRDIARVERDATADDGRRYPATARASWV